MKYENQITKLFTHVTITTIKNNKPIFLLLSFIINNVCEFQINFYYLVFLSVVLLIFVIRGYIISMFDI